MKSYTLKEAHEIQLKGDFPLAEQIYTTLLNDHPDHWLCLFFLGTLYLQTHRNGLAITMFKRASQIKPQSPEIWNNLGTAYKRENFNDESFRCLLRANSLNSDADTLNNLATIFVNEGEPHKGEHYSIASIEKQPDNAFSHWNYSLLLLEQGKYKEGFKEYAWGLRSKDRQNRDYNCAFWKGEKNKTVVVWGEQGVGDEIMFASCIPDLKKKSKRVIFDCHPRLKGLFERSFGITCYGTRKEQEIPWIWEESIDYKIPIGGIPQYFRKSLSDFPGKPYLKADPEKVKVIREKLHSLGPGPYIGISWVGGKKKTRNDLRSIPLDKWGEILKQNATYISLQYTKENVDEGKRHGLHILEEVFAHDYDETAALVDALDLVISVNTSVIHLCGALGVDCWCLTPTKRAWRYYEPSPGKMVWYDSVKQYSQEGDSWDETLNTLNQDLIEFCGSQKTVVDPGPTGGPHLLTEVSNAC